MKKLLASSFLVLVLIASVFADGDIPIGGGKTGCPNGQTSCLVAPSGTPGSKSDIPIFTKISDFLKYLFG